MFWLLSASLPSGVQLFLFTYRFKFRDVLIRTFYGFSLKLVATQIKHVSQHWLSLSLYTVRLGHISLQSLEEELHLNVLKRVCSELGVIATFEVKESKLLPSVLPSWASCKLHFNRWKSEWEEKEKCWLSSQPGDSYSVTGHTSVLQHCSKFQEVNGYSSRPRHLSQLLRSTPEPQTLANLHGREESWGVSQFNPLPGWLVPVPPALSMLPNWAGVACT